MQPPYDQREDRAEPSRRGRFWIGLLLGVAIGMTSLLIAHRVSSRTAAMRSTVGEAPPPFRYVAAEPDTGGSDIDASRRNSIVRAVDRVAPAVVTISVTQLRRERVVPPFYDDPMWRYFFPDLGRELIRKVESMGSGFVVSPEGLILTNEHVIRGASEIVVNLSDGRSFPGRIVGEPDVQADVALVKIDGGNLPVAPLGRSDDLMIGEWAIAIGNPFGFLIRDAHPTVTVGVISALNRDFNPSSADGRVYRDMIQTDASINPGNSGGPLLNSMGYVIGINTFIFTQGGGSEGIGFAIPIRRARQAMEDILRFGGVRHNFWTGIYAQDLNRWIAESLGLSSDRGAIITRVEPDSPGAKAGLRRGDVIVAVNGKPISGYRGLHEEFVGSVVGQEVQLSIVREGKEMTVAITLEEEPPSSRRSRG